VRADSRAKLIRLGDVVGTNGEQSAVTHLELAMKLKESFVLPAILGTKAAAAENQNHRMLSLELRELPTLRGPVGKFVVREYSSCNNV
jgi:hypothetical protein